MNHSLDFSFNFLKEDSLECLKNLKFSEKGTRRLCLHENNQSKMHVMLIEIKKDIIFEYHAHTHSDEVVFLIEGKLSYKFLEDKEIILEKGSIISMIIPQNIFHKVISGPEGAIYIEIINGPFSIKNTKKI